MDRERMEELLSAYLDDELQDTERAQAERLLKENATARKLLEELRLTSAIVSSLPRHTAPESIAEDVQQQIERRALLDHVPQHRVTHTSGRRTLQIFGAIAAMFVIMMTSGWYLVAHSSRQLSKQLVAESKSKEQADKEALASANKPKTGATKPSTYSSTTAKINSNDNRAPGNSGTAKTGELLAMAPTETFESKLRNQMAPELLQQHSYAQEPVQLQVVVENERQRDALLAKLTTQLGQQQFTRVSDAAARKEQSIPANQAVFEPGTPGVNYQNTLNRQVLVRARASDVGKVLGDVEAAQPPHSQMMLNVAGNTLEGNQLVKDNFIALSQSQNELAFGASNKTPARSRAQSEALESESDVTLNLPDDDNAASVTSAFLQLVGIDQKTSDELGEKMAEAAKKNSTPTEERDAAPKPESGSFAESNVGPPAPKDETTVADADANAQAAEVEEGGSLVANAMKRADDSRKNEAKEKQAGAPATTLAAAPRSGEFADVYQHKADEFITFVIDIAVAPQDTARPTTDKPTSVASPKSAKPVEHNDNRMEKKQN